MVDESSWVDLGPCGCCNPYYYYPYSSSGGYYGGGGGGLVTVPCCPNPVPTTLYFSLTSSCPLIDGHTIELTYTGDDCWAGQLPLEDCSCEFMFVTLCCVDGVWRVGGGPGDGPGFGPSCVTGAVSSDGVTTLNSCSPLDITFSGYEILAIGIESCCGVTTIGGHITE